MRTSRRNVVFGGVGALMTSALAGRQSPGFAAAPPAGTEVRLLEHGWQVLSVAFSPDGRLLASGSADLTAKLWEARRGALKRTLPKEC